MRAEVVLNLLQMCAASVLLLCCSRAVRVLFACQLRVTDALLAAFDRRHKRRESTEERPRLERLEAPRHRLGEHGRRWTGQEFRRVGSVARWRAAPVQRALARTSGELVCGAVVVPPPVPSESPSLLSDKPRREGGVPKRTQRHRPGAAQMDDRAPPPLGLRDWRCPRGERASAARARPQEMHQQSRLRCSRCSTDAPGLRPGGMVLPGSQRERWELMLMA